MLDTESVAATQGQVSQKGTGAMARMARNNFTVPLWRFIWVLFSGSSCLPFLLEKKVFRTKKEKVLWRWQCSMTFFMIEYDTFSGIRTWWDLVESFYGNIWNILEYYGLDFNSQNGKNVCFQTGLPFLIHFWDVSRALKVATRDWDSTCPSWHHVDLICLKNGDLRWSEPMSASESAEIRPETLKLGVAKNLKGYIVYCHVWLAEGM